MKKKSKQKQKGFDEKFDEAEASIDFSHSIKTKGLSGVVKLPPISIPAWLNAEIEKLAQLQANSKSAVIRQLLVESLQHKKKNSA